MLVEEEVLIGEFFSIEDKVLITLEKVNNSLKEILEVTSVTYIDIVKVTSKETSRVSNFKGIASYKDNLEEIANYKDNKARVRGT